MTTVMRRFAALLVAMGVAVCAVLFAQSAFAYGGQDASGSVSDTTPSAGKSVTVSVDHLTPDSTFTVTLNPGSVLLGTFTTNSSGSATVSVKIPSGTSSGVDALDINDEATSANPDSTIDITVGTSSSSGGDNSLAGTGVAIASIGGAGVVLLLGGGLVLLAGRRQRTTV